MSTQDKNKETIAFAHAREMLEAARQSLDLWDTQVVQRMQDLIYVTHRLQKAQENYLFAQAHFTQQQNVMAQQDAAEKKLQRQEEEDSHRHEWKLRVRP